MAILRELVAVFFSIALFVNAALFMPQILRLWRTKNPEGLSLITFGGFNLIQILAIMHGYLNQDYVLAVGFSLSLLTCGLITALIFYYRFKKHS